MVTDADVNSRHDQVALPRRRHRRRSVVLCGLAVFQFWLWGTRIVNMIQDADQFSAAFVAVHVVLYTAAIGAGVVLAGLGVNMWRESRPAPAQPGSDQAPAELNTIGRN